MAPGRSRRHRVLPPLWPQRDRRAHVHAAAHVQGGRCRDQGMTLQGGGACANATAKDWLLCWPCRCCCCCCFDNLSRVHTNGGGPAISTWVWACLQKVKDHPNPHQLYEQRLIKEGTINEEQVRAGSRKLLRLCTAPQHSFTAVAWNCIRQTLAGVIPRVIQPPVLVRSALDAAVPAATPGPACVSAGATP
jgi:hypothetical protein